MNHIKRLVAAMLPPVVANAVRWAKGRRKPAAVQAYLSGGRVPWSPGYVEYRDRFLTETLANCSLTTKFRSDEELPAGYGLGLDERCVEYPWLLAQLDAQPDRMLDAGSALNHQVILDQPAFRCKNLHILTLAPERVAFWQRGISYLFADLREIPLRSAYYDVIACISTLEHVGCDNTLYASGQYDQGSRNEIRVVIDELNRVLKPGGTLFLSMPFGVRRDFGTFRQFDRELLAWTIEGFGPVRNKTTTFFRYGPAGWERAEEQDCVACEYVEWITRPRDKWPVPLPVEPDLAAAARAVVCLRLTKA